MNTAKYLIVLENFIGKLQQLSDANPEEFSEEIAEICHALRIGKVETVTYENEGAEQRGMSTIKCFYDGGNSCESVCIGRRITGIDGEIAFYNVYAIEKETEWDEGEKSRINILIAVISTFCEKFRLAKLAYCMLYYDSGMNMYNLNQFMKTVGILCKSRKIDQFTAVRFNLKHFSVVNQHLGRDAGTLVMKKYVSLFDDILDHENEVVCRVGGDNFVTLIQSDKLQSVLDIINGKDVVYDETDNERIFINATAGVYVIKDIGNVILPTDVMDRVSLTYQLAKNSSETDIMFFDDDLLARVKRSNNISVLFPKALEDREFVVYYQPKVAIDGRHIAGAEALCRWMHDGRMVAPGEFIPVLEQGRDICKLDFYMLDAVCRDIRRWLDNGMDVVRISVNLSRRHLSDRDLLKHIVEIVDRNNVPHEYIEIELTETTTDVEFKDLKRIIGGLQKLGISTSVDDFGIGYSSLNLIKEIPWNVLKLDKSLLPAEGDDNPVQKGVMFKYIVAMAREMGLECISEGVETKEQVQLLADNKCDLVQGFYFDRPLPVEEFETRLDRNYFYNI